MVQIKDNRINRFLTEPGDSVVPAARTQYSPTMLSKKRTAQVQIYQIVPDAENGLTYCLYHRHPPLSEPGVQPECRPAQNNLQVFLSRRGPNAP